MFGSIKSISAYKWMSDKEYKANLSGMNIFFGAIIGVVMASYESSSPLLYIAVLMFSASLVIIMLYISASKRRIVYSTMAMLLVGYLWFLALSDSYFFDFDPTWLKSKYLPTMSAWLAMILFIEFTPRERPDGG